MERTENSINNEPSLQPCNPKSPLINKLVLDPPWGPTCEDQEPTLRQVNTEAPNSWMEVDFTKKTGIGSRGDCDPMMTGEIANDPQKPPPPHNRGHVINRYSKAIRGCNEAVTDLFRNIIVRDENGKDHIVPIIFAPQEKAVAAIIQDNVRKDKTLVADRIRLPMMAIHQTDMQFNQDRYTYSAAKRWVSGERFDKNNHAKTLFGITRGVPIDISYSLWVWTMYIEDMDQIAEQIFLKFNPVAYINIRGVHWETIVKYNSSGNNMEMAPGDRAIRVIKMQFNMTAESYIPQPIEQRKAVLSINQEWVDAIENEDVTQVISKLQDKVKILDA
jgi:hypothetical protein